MKICAITMVYRDHWALAQWYMHYARHLGAENLFVVAHGADPALATLCPGANILTVPRDRMDGFDGMRDRLLNGIQTGLSAVYDWVIRTDADELVCLDPDLHGSFADLLAAQQSDAVFALGLNIAEQLDDPALEDGAPALPRRPAAVFSGHYSKAWAVRNGLPLIRHGVAVRRRLLERFPFTLPRGVYLAHLKYASRGALEQANAHRHEIANGAGKGLPGSAWQKPKLTARKFYRSFRTLPQTPWEEAESAAWTQISADPTRDPGKSVIRARNIRFEARTQLPERIRTF